MKKVILCILVVVLLTGCNLNFEFKIDRDNSLEEDDKKSIEVVNDNKDEIISKLRLLGNEIIKYKENEKRISILKEYFNNSSLEIKNLYFCSSKGEFIIIPEIELPSDYNFQERTPYQKAIEKGVYYPEVYSDISNEEKIQTITIRIGDEDNLKGVLGIDYLISK